MPRSWLLPTAGTEILEVAVAEAVVDTVEGLLVTCCAIGAAVDARDSTRFDAGAEATSVAPTNEIVAGTALLSADLR